VRWLTVASVHKRRLRCRPAVASPGRHAGAVDKSRNLSLGPDDLCSVLTD